MNELLLDQRRSSRRFITGLTYLMCACGSEAQTPREPVGSGGMVGTTGGDTSVNPGSGGQLGSGGASSGGTESGGSSSGGESATSGGSPGTGGDLPGSGGSSAFTITSPAFESLAGCSLETPLLCDVFPDENVSHLDNANRSPELHWTGVPAGTQSFALVLFDVSYGQAHWALWNIPADVAMLAADLPQDTAMLSMPPGSQQANANFATTSESGYFGPHMPCNLFEFQLYALSTDSFTPQDPESSVLISIELAELKDTVLGRAKLAGRANDYETTCE